MERPVMIPAQEMMEIQSPPSSHPRNDEVADEIRVSGLVRYDLLRSFQVARVLAGKHASKSCDC